MMDLLDIINEAIEETEDGKGQLDGHIDSMKQELEIREGEMKEIYQQAQMLCDKIKKEQGLDITPEEIFAMKID